MPCCLQSLIDFVPFVLDLRDDQLDVDNLFARDETEVIACTFVVWLAKLNCTAQDIPDVN